MSSFIRFYRGSLIFSLICLILGALYGWMSSGTIAGVFEVLWIVAVLSVLEVSLSFDNAVVNASVLKDMDPLWQRRFLTWGIAFAVFGMRIVFPLAIVAISAHIGPIDAVYLSLNHPEKYEQLVSAAHVGIAGFGGAFLLMVGLKFFFDADKEVHWIAVIEKRISRFSSLPALEIALLLLVMWGISSLLNDADALTFLVAGMLGLVAHIAVDGISAMLEASATSKQLVGAAAKNGLGGFIYLNILDATFSFDGVIGAFVLSSNMVVIALGLSIGAFFVRSMTIHLVEKGTLTEFRYLEHGAFWAIVALGVIMLFSAYAHIPEVITGLIGVVLIGLSLWWSVKAKHDH